MPTLPPDVQLVADGDTTRIVLPVRPRTTPGLVAIFPIGFGLLFAGFAVLWILAALGVMDDTANAPAEIDPEIPALPEAPARPATAPAEDRGIDPFDVIFALFGLPFVAAGLVPICFGLAMLLPNHAEIVVTATHLVSREHIGPIRIRRRRPLTAVTGLVIGQSNAVASVDSPRSSAHGIHATCEPPHAMLPLSRGYPPPTVAAVAHALADVLERHRGTVTLRDHAPKVPIAVSFDLPPPPEPVAVPETPERELPPPQPSGSTITFIPTPESLTFMVPRTGFRGTAAFFLFFSLFWNGITFCVAGGMVASFVGRPTLDELTGLAFISIFVAVGVGMALAGVQTAFRKAVILATRDSLVFTQTGPIRNVEFHWAPGDLTAIRVGDSGTKVNNRQLKQLQIHATQNNGTSHRGMLTGRDDDELHWLAATLRNFYGVRT